MCANIIHIDFKSRKRFSPAPKTEAEYVAENSLKSKNEKTVTDLVEALRILADENHDLSRGTFLLFDEYDHCISLIDLSNNDISERYIVRARDFYEFVRSRIDRHDN